jgi:hypothetical protein
MEKHQGMPPAEVQKAFGEFLKRLHHTPPLPHGGNTSRDIPQEKRPHD